MFRRPCFVALLVVLGSFAAPARGAVLPDLVVTSIAAPTSVVAGGAVTVRTTVKNLQGRAGSSYVRVVLSKDKVVGSTDKVLGKRFVPGLAAGATSTASKTWTIPAATGGGAWFLLACADATKLVREAREGNNCRARALTVVRPNRPPVAVADEVGTHEDTDLEVTTATLLGNDTDADGDALALTGVSSATNGSVTLDGGTVTFSPAPDFHGSAGFSYTVSDGKAAPVQGSVAVLVTPENDAPQAVDDIALTAQDTPVVLPYADLLANDVDVDGTDLLELVAAGDATNGTVALDPVNAEVTFTPTNGFYGTAWFFYTVSDGTATDVGKVDVTVTPGPIRYVLAHESPTVTEGSFTTLWVSLSRAPDADVTVTPVSPDGRLWVVTDPLTFTPSSWNVAQAVTVHAEHDDDLADGVGVLWLESPGIDTEQTGWNIEDDDTQQVLLSGAPVTLPETGSDEVNVSLAFDPPGSVAVTCSISPSGHATVTPSTLVFNTAGLSQTVTVAGSNDLDTAADAVSLTCASTGATSGVADFTVADDDTQAIQTSTSAAALAEGGSTTVGVRLAFQPAGNVTVSAGSSDTGAVTVSPSSLVFTPSNWATEQNVTLNGVQDVDLAAESATLSLTSSGLTPKTVTATVTDDDTQAVHSSATSRSIREGTSSSIDITLSYQPLSNTTVTCSASPAGSVGVSPATMTFTPANFATPQALMLNGTVDGDQIDDEAVVTCSATGATSATINVVVVEIV